MCVNAYMRCARYFTFSRDRSSRSTERGASKFFLSFDDVAYDKQVTMREYFSMGRHEHRLLLSLLDVRGYLTSDTRQREPVNLIQTG